MPEASRLSRAANVTGLVTMEAGGPLIITAIRAWQGGIAADAYIQLFDSSTTGGITLGTTQPAWTTHLNQSLGDITNGDGLPNRGLVFNNGLVVASTTTPDGATTSTTQVRVTIL